jgi:hypothetical protein
LPIDQLLLFIQAEQGPGTRNAYIFIIVIYWHRSKAKLVLGIQIVFESYFE